MRILLPTLHYYPDRPSGSTRLAYDEAIYLARHGHEPWIITQDLSRSRPELAVEDGVHVLCYPSPRLHPLDPRRVSIHQRMTAGLLARYSPKVDVIHGHTLLQYAGVLDHYKDRVTACFSVHSPARLEMDAARRGARVQRQLSLMASSWLTHRIERRCLEASDRISCDSEYTRNAIGRLHAPEIANRVVVIPGWVDMNRLRIADDRDALKRSLGWPQDVPVLFTLRRLVPRMGLDTLIRCCALLKGASLEYRLIIGGAGPLRQQLEALIADLGLSNEVQCIGYVPDESLVNMYAAADAFVLPTADLECFGLIALEALASGRPVLATPVAAIPEILRQVEPRWLAPDRSVQGLYALLADFLAGRLPQHHPETLRDIAARYSQDRVLQRLTDWALGDGQSASLPEERS